MDAIDRAPTSDTFPPAWDIDLEFAPRIDARTSLRAQRVGATVFVLALHALFAWLLERESHARIEAPKEDHAIVVDFIRVLPPETIRAPAADAAPSRVSTTARVASTRSPPRNLPPRPVDSLARDDNAPLQLYAPDGSLKIPDNVVVDLERNAGADRQFDFQVPDLERAGHWLERPPALVYEGTRFEKYWRPNESLLDEVLRKAVEKTTKEVRIPIPGAPGRELVCKVSILAAGGACGVERYGAGGPRPGLDDPATLDANEAAACEAWWNRIVGTTTQSEWHRTRKLYDEQCRKPLATTPPPPADPELAPPPRPLAQPEPAAQ